MIRMAQQQQTQTEHHHGEIVIEGPEPLVIDPSSTKRRPPLDREEARLLTAEIQRTSVRLWLLVSEAHDRAAHFALGYDTWDDYVRAEFKMSPSRSYQLLDTGHVMRELAAAGADLDSITPPPARIISRIKDRLPEVRKAAKGALKDGETVERALRDLAREPRQTGAGVEPSAGPAEAPPSGRRRTAQMTCPACQGSGKVDRGLATRLRTFMKNIPKKE